MTTCGDIKHIYKDSQCCGETASQPILAPTFDIEVLAEASTNNGLRATALEYEKTHKHVDFHSMDFGDIVPRLMKAEDRFHTATIAHDNIGMLADKLHSMQFQTSDFIDTAVTSTKYNSLHYGVPFGMESIAMYYNPELVSSVPTTWEAMKEFCQNRQHCVAIPGGSAGPDAYHNFMFLSSFGGYVFKLTDNGFVSTDTGLSSEEAFQSVEYMDSLVKSGVLMNTDFGGAIGAFMMKQAPFLITGPWGMNMLSTMNYSIASLPSFPSGPSKPFVGVRIFVAPKTTQNVSESKDIIQKFTSKSSLDTLYTVDSKIPVLKSQYDAITDPKIAAFAKSARDGIPMPNIPETGFMWEPLGAAFAMIRGQAYTNTTASATEAFRVASETLRSQIG